MNRPPRTQEWNASVACTTDETLVAAGSLPSLAVRVRPVGKVYLIGAGPGAIELLTLKAVRALACADVLLLDELVNRDVLQFAKPQARVIEVGKRGGCRSTPQAFIERLMIRLARAGKVVARVKGGDPFVFGRGGEELSRLRAGGIPVEVVSGITAGIAGPAALGIPVTHRDYCHGVTLITGHTRDGGEPQWEALARGGTTIVIYMGMGELPALAERLMQAGFRPDVPAAVVQSATTRDQRSVVATLCSLADAAASAGLASPAVIVIGQVAALALDAIAQHAMQAVA